ncbi:sec-independent protein translocase protein TATA, chloroplastic [Cornus florida]|uniref:sec-independent protein translocase protein TATA, chloroplastic n=1 Tax=Cornus florida TaxID=4283 RepID=UPI0028A1824B|nr:sec-independent protein translocase protein TATA, chloroplastic [Cornus florida]
MEIAISSATLPLSLPCATTNRRSASPSLSFSASNSCFFNNTLSTKNWVNRSLVLGRTRAKSRGLSCNCLFGLGVPELVVIAGVAALVFGPKKLPEVGRSIGKTVKSFQEAAKEFESELKKEPGSTSDSSIEKSTAVSEEEKLDIKVPSTKENS